jgi:hypothetical protein
MGLPRCASEDRGVFPLFSVCIDCSFDRWLPQCLRGIWRIRQVRMNDGKDKCAFVKSKRRSAFRVIELIWSSLARLRSLDATPNNSESNTAA